jgi:uncharacterized protein (TIGR02611 family)
MLQQLRTHWRQLRRARPGERFRQQYERSRAAGRSTLRKVVFLGGGAAVLAAGIFFLPAPGPGILIVLVGAGMIAQESRTAARALDWAELRLRALAGAARQRWRRATVPVRLLLVLAALALAGAAAFGAYRILFGADGGRPA